MRRILIGAIALAMAGCNDETIQVNNSAPTAAITSHEEGEVVPAGEQLFRGTGSDPNNPASELTATWFLGDDVVCADGVLDEDGRTECAITVSADQLTVVLEIQDPRNATGSDRIDLVLDEDVPVDQPPTAPEVTITPADPLTGDALVATLTTESVDPDGDAVTYGWTWTVDGQPDATTAEVPASATSKGQTWSVTVTPTAGGLQGPPATTSVTIGNTPPDAPTVSVASTTSGTCESVAIQTADEISVPANGAHALPAFTASLWTRVSPAPSHVLVKGDNGTNEWSITVNEQNELNLNRQGLFSAIQGGVLPFDTWLHIAASWDATGGTLYVDGVNVGTTTASFPVVTSPLTIGNFPGHPEGSMNGFLSDVALFDRVLSASEVADLAADAVVPGDLTGLVSWWPLDDATGGTATDLGPAGADGTVLGATWTNECRSPAASLLCSVDSPSFDADGDPVTYTMSWTADGAPVASTDTTWPGDTVEGADPDAAWVCTATPSDGTDDGTPASASASGAAPCGGLRFDATGSEQIEVAADAAFVADDTALTVEAWVRWEDQGEPDYWPIASQGWGNDPTARFFFAVTNDLSGSCAGDFDRGDVVFELLDASTCLRSSRPLVPGQWTHLAAVFDAGTLSLYRNGELDVSETLASTALVSVSAAPVLIGTSGSGGSGGLGGTLAGVRIASAAEYTTDFAPAFPLVTTPDTLGLWALSDPADPGADSSGAGRHGTVTGGAWMADCPTDDVDRDGTIAWEDCNELDDLVYPWAGDTWNDGVDGDCDGLDCETVSVGAKYYALCSPGLGWFEARDACQTAGYGDLMSLDDASVESALTGLVAAVGDPACATGGLGCPWIGLRSDLTGTWEWSDGTTASYLNWAPQEPTGDGSFAHFNRYGTIGWNDSPASASFGFACEL